MQISETQLDKLNGRFQFMLLLVMFFPTVINALFAGSPSLIAQGNTLTFKWGEIIGIYILSYLLIMIIGKRMSHRIYGLIDAALFAGVFAFVPVLFILGEHGTGIIRGWTVLTLGGANTILIIIPSLIFSLLLIDGGSIAGDILKKRGHRSLSSHSK